MKNIKVVELFAGVGGFRLGLEKSSKSFKTIWANQWEPSNKTKQWAFDCYEANFGKSDKHINKNIEEVIDEVPEHDLLVGGFPCQDYSVARTQAKGIEGKKGVLWWSINKILIKRHPKYVLLENVDRLLKSPTNQRGRDFGIILKSFYDEGYAVEWRIINAAEYGHAQKRRRVFIFAYHQNSTLYQDKIKQIISVDKHLIEQAFFNKEFPIESTNYKKTTQIDIADFSKKDVYDISSTFEASFYNAGIMIGNQIYSIEVSPRKKDPKNLKELLEEDVDSKYYLNGSLEKWNYLKGKKSVERIKPNGELYNYSEGKLSFPDSLDKPARTILTSESTLNRSTHIIEDKPGKKRKLTPVECERINGFPDNWTNTGMPERFRYFCMGNALVVPVVKSVGKQIVNFWSKEGE